MKYKKNIFDVNVDALTINEFVQQIDIEIKNKKSTHVLGLNAEKIVEIQTNKQLKKIILQANIVHADGISIRIASLLLRMKIPERVAGIDLMQKLLILAEKNGYTIYLLGAEKSVINDLKIELIKKYPNIQILGSRDGYFTNNEWIDVLNEISELKPQIIFVGITSPKKEYIIDYLIRNNVNSVFMGVGGSFDVLSGKIKRAPYWMQKFGLEWFYRLIQEPNRLLKRYLLGNIQFTKLLLKEIIYRYIK